MISTTRFIFKDIVYQLSQNVVKYVCVCERTDRLNCEQKMPLDLLLTD